MCTRCILLAHLSTASDVCAHDHNKATTPERLPARFEVLGGQKRAEAAAWVLHSLIQRSLAVFTQPLRHLAFVRPLRICYMHELKRSKIPSSIARSPSHLHMRDWTEFARSRHWERIACSFIFVSCVISTFLRFHPGNMATPAAVNPSGE